MSFFTRQTLRILPLILPVSLTAVSSPVHADIPSWYPQFDCESLEAANICHDWEVLPGLAELPDLVEQCRPEGDAAAFILDLLETTTCSVSDIRSISTTDVSREAADRYYSNVLGGAHKIPLLTMTLFNIQNGYDTSQYSKTGAIFAKRSYYGNNISYISRYEKVLSRKDDRGQTFLDYLQLVAREKLELTYLSNELWNIDGSYNELVFKSFQERARLKGERVYKKSELYDDNGDPDLYYIGNWTEMNVYLYYPRNLQNWFCGAGATYGRFQPVDFETKFDFMPSVRNSSLPADCMPNEYGGYAGRIQAKIERDKK